MKKKITKAEWLEKNGFTLDGITWCIFGDDTFAIKDQLKEMGCKFMPILKWHSAVAFNDIPDGYGMISFAFDEIMVWNEDRKDAFFLDNAEEKIEQRLIEAAGPNLSEFVGEVGERLRDKVVVLKSARGFDGKFGWTNIYTFMDGDNELVWFTAKNLEFEKGDILNLTGTVKKHEEFKGTKTTQLSRCILKKLG